MSSDTFDLYSAYYDLLYADKDYAGEAEFIAGILAKHSAGKSILELGCGTGIHAAHFAEKGFTVHAIDRSAEMLKMAEERAAKLNPPVSTKLSFAQGDLRDFKVIQPYDHVISLFDVISYLPDNAALKTSLALIKAALKPGGLLVFDCWYGPAVFTQRPHTRVRRLTSLQAEIVRVAEPVFHHSRNVVDVNYDIYATNMSTGQIQNFKEVHPMRCFFEAELDELLLQAGFERSFACEWFTGAAPSINTWSVLFGYRLGSGS